MNTANPFSLKRDIEPWLVSSALLKLCASYREACRLAWALRRRQNMTVRQLAEEGRFIPQHVTDWLNPDDGPRRRSLPAERIKTFELLCGNAAVTQWPRRARNPFHLQQRALPMTDEQIRARLLEIAGEPWGIKERDLHARIGSPDRPAARRVLYQLVDAGEISLAEPSDKPRYFRDAAAGRDWIKAGRPERTKGTRGGGSSSCVKRGRPKLERPKAPPPRVVTTPPVDRRAVVLPADYVSVLDPRQCRPWASVAASLIGGGHG